MEIQLKSAFLKRQISESGCIKIAELDLLKLKRFHDIGVETVRGLMTKHINTI